MNMKRFIVALLFVFAVSGVAYPWGSSTGDGSRGQSIQETAVFFNNSGSTLIAGQIVVLDKTNSGVTAGTTLGGYVTTTAVADVSGIVGVVKSISVADQRPVVVITKGPADTLVLDSSDSINISNYVSTSTTLGYGGVFDGVCYNTTDSRGCILGQALEDGNATDTGKIWVWVNPD